MTNSAKQDTKVGPAETGETESAAKPEATARPEATAEPAADSPAPDEAKPDIDDVKAKFREALDRKRQHHDEGQGKGGHESGKVSGAHGPAASRRNFRRKSG
jgi:Family of unknown function (DUF5302)